MALLDMFTVVAAATAVVPILKQVIDLLSFNRRKKSLETSLRLHQIVLKNKSRLISLETRDGKLRRVILTPSDLDSSDNVRKAYETLLEQDLSEEYEKIFKQSEHRFFYLNRYLNVVAGEKESLLVRLTNSGLITAALSSKLSATGKSAEASSSILELMLGRRMKVYGKAYAYLYSALGIGFAAYILLPDELATIASVALPLAMIVALSANQKLLEFRVSKGLFGNNASEALEFIRFVQAHSDKSDFNDGDKMRKLMPEAEATQLEEKIVFGQGAAA